MQVNYEPFIQRVIHKYEGGYGWNKKDPGGPTKYGITCWDLAEHRHQKMTSMAVWAPLVRDMILSEASAIYNTKYATGIRFADLPSGPDCCMGDYGINSGNARPVRVARALVGLPAGGMDQALIDRIKASDPKNFVDQMCAERLRFMHAIRNGSAWAEFGHGWQSRVDDLRVYSEHLAAGTVAQAPVAPDLSNTVTPKAKNVAQTAPKSTSGGAIAAGTTAYMSGQGWAITAAAVGAVIAAGVGYELWQVHKANTANALVHI